MSLLSYTELLELVQSGVINAPVDNINSSSIDLTFGDELMLEDNTINIGLDGSILPPCVVDLDAKKSPRMKPYKMHEAGYVVSPGEFFLATTQETFNLPNDIVAEFVLKSSQARSGLFHALAGYCDPGWNGSKLTMEFQNVCRNHSLLIKPGAKCGQVKFYRVTEVPADKSYAVVGQYNGQQSVQVSKGVR